MSSAYAMFGLTGPSVRCEPTLVGPPLATMTVWPCVPATCSAPSAGLGTGLGTGVGSGTGLSTGPSTSTGMGPASNLDGPSRHMGIGGNRTNQTQGVKVANSNTSTNSTNSTNSGCVNSTSGGWGKGVRANSTNTSSGCQGSGRSTNNTNSSSQGRRTGGAAAKVRAVLDAVLTYRTDQGRAALACPLAPAPALSTSPSAASAAPASSAPQTASASPAAARALSQLSAKALVAPVDPVSVESAAPIRHRRSNKLERSSWAASEEGARQSLSSFAKQSNPSDPATSSPPTRNTPSTYSSATATTAAATSATTAATHSKKKKSRTGSAAGGTTMAGTAYPDGCPYSVASVCAMLDCPAAGCSAKGGDCLDGRCVCRLGFSGSKCAMALY